MDSLFIFIIYALITLPIVVTIIFIPYWTRRTESFGVSIPDKIYDNLKIKNMRKSYAIIMTIISFGIILLLLFINNYLHPLTSTFAVLYSVIIIIYLIISFFVYLKYHTQMKNYKQKKKWFQDDQHVVIDTKFHYEKLTLSNGFYIIPLVIVSFTIFLTIINYDLFPKDLPMNYSLTGEVTRTVTKSYRSVLLLPMLQLFLISIFLFVNSVIKHAKQQLSAENPETSRKQNIIFRRRWSIFLFLSGVGLILMLSIAQLSLIYPISPSLLFSLFLIVIGSIIVGSVILSITTGQGGSRLRLSTKGSSIGNNRDDDMHWKFGQFYFNPEDPSLFLEKRFGIGWTVNWARPLGWIILLLIVGISILIPILLTY